VDGSQLDATQIHHGLLARSQLDLTRPAQGAGKIRKHLIFKLLGSSLIENELIIANQCL
jgi:hypothetical protein